MNIKSKSSYLLKAEWPSTSVNIIVEGKDEDDAFLRGVKKVKRMEGGLTCVKLTLLRQLS